MKSPIALALLLSLASAAADCSRHVKCDSTLNAPVCGSDGHTYTNQCVFKNAACHAAKKLTKLFDGACDETPNPFCGLRCSDTTQQPVCGSNGVTYKNPCLLSTARCTNVTLTTAYEGACITKVPTSSLPCKTTTKPSSKPTEKPCNHVCPMIYNPVCGSNGETYTNSCLLSVAACKNKSLGLVMTQPGACPCVKGCTKIALPVCGSNGQTYMNQCLLDNAACVVASITKVHDGKCTPPPPTGVCRMMCKQHSVCKIDATTGQAYCADTCDEGRCAPNEKCSLQQVQCIKAPCPPVATCTKTKA